jgi:hypothetical protein
VAIAAQRLGAALHVLPRFDDKIAAAVIGEPGEGRREEGEGRREKGAGTTGQRHMRG